MIQQPFMLHGKPFFPLGGQSHNSSGYNDTESDTAFRAVKLLHGNLLEIPVYWEQVEPGEGQFDFACVDALLEKARRYDLHLVLLWFGTWKNGNMDYAPAWVKSQPQRFERVQSPTGKKLWVLSSHCPATLAADRRAFTELCRYLKNKDGEGTVLSLQVENEPGILGSDRDYGPAAQADYERPVPAELMKQLTQTPNGPVVESWQQAGSRPRGTWPEVFGDEAGEMMTAWSIAVFCDQLAEAGKAILDIPMYVNVWLRENGWMVAGESYPSGGAVSKTLDIYKWCAPHLNFIAPDIYIADDRGYAAQCEIYQRADNPLFIPESAPGGSNAWNLFRALGQYNAIGFAFFAVEEILDAGGQVRPAFQPLVDSFHCAAAALPLLLEYQGTGKLHAVVQAENVAAQPLELEGWLAMADFGASYKDWRHPRTEVAGPAGRGRGLVIQAGRDELFVVGADFRLLLRPMLPPGQLLDISTGNDRLLGFLAPYISVEEGHFDESGAFVTDRRRNGDEIDHGVWVTPDVGVVRVVMAGS